MLEVPHFEDKALLIDWLITNKSSLIAQKKSVVKYADAISYTAPMVNDKGDVCKADTIPADAKNIKVRSIINTTNLMDSHSDVHIDQLWNKSLKDNKDIYLCQEHNFSYSGIISDKVHAFAKQTTFKDLGIDLPGNTQALVFDSIIDTGKATFGQQGGAVNMADRYKSGMVKNHSVGMRYVTLHLCVNDDRYDKEFANWNKYIDQVANKQDAEDQGYFWAVTEAKVIEGSAVIKGSNYATPTTSVEAAKGTSTDIEPVIATQKNESIFKQLKLQK